MTKLYLFRDKSDIKAEANSLQLTITRSTSAFEHPHIGYDGETGTISGILNAVVDVFLLKIIGNIYQ